MNSRKWQIALALCTLVASLSVSAAQRTFVSGSGVDTNPCTLTLPCRSFATAIGQTAPSGEVIVLDSAGYGPVAITKSVSIIAPAGVYGGISVSAPNGTGIDINGSNIAVVLRGLSIIGQGGETGVQFGQGSRLTIEDCEIANLDNGVDAAAPNSVVTVRNTVIRDVLYGFYAIEGTDATLDGLNILAKNGGIEANFGGRITVTNTVVVMLSGGRGILAWATSGDTTEVMVSHSTISGGDAGFAVFSTAGGTARAVSDGNAMNNMKVAAFSFVGGGGTELIYTSGTNTLSPSVAAIAVGGALTLIGQH